MFLNVGHTPHGVRESEFFSEKGGGVQIEYINIVLLQNLTVMLRDGGGAYKLRD